MSTNNARRRGGQGNSNINNHHTNNNSKNPNGKGGKGNGNNSNTNSSKVPPKTSFSNNPQATAQQADQDTKLQGQLPKESLGFFWAILRLIVIIIKGLVALTIFAVIFNLALVTINKTLMDGKLEQYINAPTWKDVFGESDKRHRYR